jgi:CRISPR/Cas system type I-B associated protein Csh2 (Cas7 group RAMP superfamily)
MKTKIANEWADMIASLKKSTADKIPDGFRSVKEWASVQNIDRSTADKLIKQSCESGLMEKRNFRIETAAGVRSIAHYKIIK